MRSDTTAWNCFGCNRSGDAITFLATLENVSPMQAAEWIRERYGSGFVEPSGGMVKTLKEFLRPKKNEQFSFSAIEPTWLEIHWEKAWFRFDLFTIEERGEFPGYIEYMFDRGFTWKTLVKWEIGYDPITDMIVIPLRDSDRILIGAKGRAWREDQNPRYTVLGGGKHGFPTAKVGRIVFGTHHAGKGGEVLLREGELNVIACDQLGVRAVGISGHSFTDTQARIVTSLYDSVTIFFDADEASQQGAREAAEKLFPHLPVRLCEPVEKDPVEMEGNELREVIASARPFLRTVIRSASP